MTQFTERLLRGLGPRKTEDLPSAIDDTAMLRNDILNAYFATLLAESEAVLDLGDLTWWSLRDERIIASAALIMIAHERRWYFNRQQRILLLEAANSRWNNTQAHLEWTILKLAELRYQGLTGIWYRMTDWAVGYINRALHSSFFSSRYQVIEKSETPE